MEETNPVKIVRSLIENCDGYVTLATTIGPSPRLEKDHFGKLAERVKVDNEVGEIFRGQNKGWPFASLVQVAFDNTTPVLLISSMSDHTRNIIHDKRVSILIDGTGGSNRMNSPRATFNGGARIADKEHFKEMFLAKHPQASAYIDFEDFDMYTIRVYNIRLNAGFGKAFWLYGNEITEDIGE